MFTGPMLHAFQSRKTVVNKAACKGVSLTIKVVDYCHEAPDCIPASAMDFHGMLLKPNILQAVTTYLLCILHA